MSNERKDQDQDRLVTETYKSLARERAPDHLNEKVLRVAAQAGRSRYTLARTWMRPAAWVATISLSLAIVLELNRLPQVEPESVGISSSDVPAVPVEQDSDEAPNVAPTIASTIERQNAAEVNDSDATRQFAPKDMAVLREAENKARLQAGPDQAGAVVTRMDDVAEDRAAVVDTVAAEKSAAVPSGEAFAGRSLAARLEKKELAAGLSCPEEVRKTAESWYACIEALRDEGAVDAAGREFEDFERKFPDFVDPDADR